MKNIYLKLGVPELEALRAANLPEEKKTLIDAAYKAKTSTKYKGGALTASEAESIAELIKELSTAFETHVLPPKEERKDTDVVPGANVAKILERFEVKPRKTPKKRKSSSDPTPSQEPGQA